MPGILQRAFAQGLSSNQPTRDRLLFAVGTTAIGWYLLAITFLGLYPLATRFGRLFDKREPAAKTATSPSVKPLDELIATRREKANSARAAADKDPQNEELRAIAEKAVADLKAAEQSIQTPKLETVLDLWQFMAFSVATISGTLATFVGMVLGFGQVTAPNAQQPIPAISPMQQAAAWAYFGSLLYALALWGIDTFLRWTGVEMPDLDPAISRLGQSLLGLFGGVLAVVLNATPPGNPSAPTTSSPTSPAPAPASMPSARAL